MKRIDILGAAGCGKTTVLNHAREPLRKTLPASAVELAVVRSLKASSSVNVSQRLLCSIPKFKGLFQTKYIIDGEKSAFPEFVDRHEDFFELVQKNAYLPGRSQYRRIEGYYYFINTVRRIAFLERWLADDDKVVFDESLSQKVYSVTPWDLKYEDDAYVYFERMPLPTALIHIDADANQVVRQVKSRALATGNVIPGHRGASQAELIVLTEACLRFARIASMCLQSRGCNVLTLHASSPIAKNAKTIVDFVKGIVK